MTQPRRAADTSVEVTMDHDSTPRRGRGARAFGPVVRRAVAPLAVVSLVAASAVLSFVPIGDRETDVADPLLQAEVHLGVSRHRERVPLVDAPTAGPSPTVTAIPSVSAVPSASVVPSTTPAAPSEEPTPAPEPETPSEEPTPTPTPTPTPEAAAAPAVDYSELSAEAGTRYATSPVNVRTGPGQDFDVITTLSVGRAVTITETSSDGWQQVSRDGEAGWIKDTFLSETEPVRERTQEAATASESTGYGTSACSNASSIEGGLTSRAVSVLRAVCNAFPNVSSYGGYRAGGGSYHSSGRAIDVMISGDAGWEIANWARSNAGSLGIIEVIYSQKIWTTQRSGEGWRGMSDRGSATANHYDHVHISVR